MNSRSSKWMADVLSELDTESSRCGWWQRWVYIDEGPSECLEEKHTANPPSGSTNCQCFFCIGKNSVVKIAHSSSEIVL
jgi:hypothetical protein